MQGLPDNQFCLMCDQLKSNCVYDPSLDDYICMDCLHNEEWSRQQRGDHV